MREHVKNAARPVVGRRCPPNAEMGKMLLDGKVDAFAANRTRMEELVRDVAGLRVLSGRLHGHAAGDRRSEGKGAQLAEINRFLADVRKSGLPAGVARSGERRRCQSGSRAAAIAVTLYIRQFRRNLVATHR